MGFIIFLHTVVCIFLSIIILMQSGRGGGLTEAFSSAESLFGARTNAFLVKATSVLAGLFLITCMTLAFFSSKKEKSLMTDRPIAPAPSVQTNAIMPAEALPKQATEDTK